VARPTRDPADTRAIAEYNERLKSDARLATSTVPLRDGVAISVKRSEARPLADALHQAAQALRSADFNANAADN
jgi:hypothetical protein